MPRLLISGEIVAQFKFTVLLMPTGSHKITGITIDPSQYESEHKIEDEEIKVRHLPLYKPIL